MEITDKVYLYGASGHAKVVMDLAKQAGYDVPYLIDDNSAVNELAGVPVIHLADDLSPMIVTIGDCQIRSKIVEKLGDREFLTVIHPSAIKAESVKLGYGTVVMAGVVLNPYSEIGNHCIVNTGAVVEHDCKIGDFVHIAPHSTICGATEVGEGTWIGAGTTIIQCVKIGKNCFIGAGAVVVNDIPDNSLCYGNPARVIKRVADE